MKHLKTYPIAAAALLTAALLTTQCERRPLVDVSHTHYVRVYVDENLKNVTTGFYNPTLEKPYYTTPNILRVVLYNPSDGQVAAERYLRNRNSDERGTYFDGYVEAAPGHYHLLTYNFGTESTLIRDPHLYYGIQAYTNEISGILRSTLSSRADEDERIVYIPDHLFTDRNDELNASSGSNIDTLRNADGDHFTASSIVLSYYLQIRVKGIDWISSATGLLTGMVGSVSLNNRHLRSEDPVTIYFEMQRGPSAANEGVIYTTFHTFGRLPYAGSKLSITFDVRTTDGRALTTTIDITDKFSEQDAIEHQWLLLDHVLNIPEPEDPGGEGGGFIPGVDEWQDIETEINI